MRRILTEYLKEGDIIAKDIVSYDGGILLRQDTRFRTAFKSKLIERNIKEVYIEDEVSKGIEVKEILEPKARKVIAQDIEAQFIKLQKSLELDIEILAQTVNFLIEQLSEQDMILELEDLKVNDNYTYEHCIAVAILTNIVCSKLNIDQEQKQDIVLGALLHDIGKIIIPKDILNKPGRLTQSEYETVQTHTQIGYMMIKDYPEIHTITKLIILCHHEREDGSGYPLGKGKELHIGAKIVAACDLYHALISDRCYRQGLPINEAIAIGQKEPINSQIREVIENCFAYYPIGSMVCLNDGNIAIVEKNFCNDIRRPIVRIVSRENGKIVERYKVNLQKQNEYYIVKRYKGRI